MDSININNADKGTLSYLYNVGSFSYYEHFNYCSPLEQIYSFMC